MSELKELGEPGTFRSAWNRLTDWGASPVLRKIVERYVRKGKFEKAVWFGSAAIPALIGILREGGPADKIRADEALVKIGAPAVPALIEVLKDGNRGWRASDALGKIGKPAIPALIEALKDANLNVRWNASQALNRVGTHAVPILIDALGEEDVQREIARVLKYLDYATAVPMLIATLKDENHNVRRGAIWGLGMIGDASAMHALVDALKDEQEDVRELAARALGAIGDGSVVSALVASLKSGGWNVRLSACGAIGSIAEKGGDCSAAVPALIDALKDEKVRGTAAWAIGSIAEKGGDCSAAVPALIDALKDEKVDVRGTAAWALGEIGDASAVAPLLEAMERARINRGDAQFRESTAAAVAKLAEKTDIDLKKVKEILVEYAGAVKGDAAEKRNTKLEAQYHYVRISAAARKRAAQKHALAGDGVILEGSFKPPSDKKMYRQARAMA